MTVGVLKVTLRLFGINSLKEKRSVIKHLISQISNKYNVSIIESDNQDSKVWASIAVAMVRNSKDQVEKTMDSLVDLIEERMGIEISSEEREVY
ncbi:MAG: uncharacterized protein PWQ20_177 [Thermotogaceae bacterium]|jgi:hypothetical protein|nr:uncharacterized protein [Thermotogaceae bacterium]MDN5337107.1 uncharacterized protein [Thermotogaceae bacterium]